MTSTHSSFLRSPLADAFTSMLKTNSASSSSRSTSIPAAEATMPVSTAEQPSISNGFPTSSLKPPAATAPSSSEHGITSAATPPSSARSSSSSSSTFQRSMPPRPLSEVIRSESHVSPEAEALRNLQEYERNLNSMASTNLDTWFKDDLEHVNKWFSSLNDVERTATVYSLLQVLNRVQIRFFSTVLRQMGQQDPVESLLSPAFPDKAEVMQQQAQQQQLAMTKAEMEASQKFMSVLRPYRTPSSSANAVNAAAAAAAAAAAMVARGNNGVVDHRHSYALGETTDEQQHALFGNSLGNDFLSPRPASAHFGGMVSSTSSSSLLSKPTTAPTSPLFGSSSSGSGGNARPRSVIEGDLSSIFSNNGWSSFGVAGARPQGVGMMDHRTGNSGSSSSAGRPKSADISSWSFGAEQQSLSSAAAGWMSPTRSTFLEHAKTIERPNSASDIDLRHPVRGGGNFRAGGSGGMYSDNNRLNTPPRNRRPNSMIIPGTVPETDERQFADIVLSTYPVPQKSTSATLMAAAAAAVSSSPMTSRHHQHPSPVPTTSSSASLAPYWDHHPHQAHISTSSNNNQRHQLGGVAGAPANAASTGYGRFLNPNDYPPEEYLSDHSESSHMSGSRYSNRHQQNNANQGSGGRKKTFARGGGGGASSSSSSGNKEKKYTDAVDMQLLQDVPAWLRSLRLHKYNPIFERTKWQDMIRMDDEALSAKGVAALGARRKMLKVFDQVKQHCEKNNIPY